MDYAADCRDHFCRHEDGSWECLHACTLEVPPGRIQVPVGTRFYPGSVFMNFDLVAWLDRTLKEDALECP